MGHRYKTHINAMLLGLFSGFPDHRFPETIAKRLKEALSIRNSLVFVSAWPVDSKRNDEDSAGMYAMFLEYGIEFDSFCVIDNRTDKSSALQLIENASCIFLMGGNATQQYELICSKGIRDAIRQSSAVILGVSAGSTNMAERALDVWESDIPYEGLGLTDITVKAHVNRIDDELIQELARISSDQNIQIHAMADESAVFIDKDCCEFIGTIRLVKNGQICSL